MDFTLSTLQYQMVLAAMAGALALLGGAAGYFVLVREQLTRANRHAVTLAAVICGIAAFHYSRILGNWSDAFRLEDGRYVPTGVPFIHGYRYADWIITVPMLVIQLVLVLNLPAGQRRSLATKLALAAGAMVALGFPGEVADSTTIKLAFWVLGCVPFAWLCYTLWVELGQSLRRQPEHVARSVSNARLTLVTTWLIYPIVYLFPVIGFGGAAGEMTRQIGYSIADVVAKPGYGLLILWVAHLKSKAERDADPTTATGHDAEAPTVLVAPAPRPVPVVQEMPAFPIATVESPSAATPSPVPPPPPVVQRIF